MANLRLEIHPARSRFGVEDDVPVRVLLFNLGDDPVTVNARFAVGAPDGPGELTFSVTNPAGEALPFGARVNIGLPGSEDFMTLTPNNCVGKLLDLVDYFPLSDPGAYRVSASYRAPAQDGVGPADAWTGSIESEPVTIELQ